MKMQDDTAKTIIMMIVVMAFVLPGFEHSIANMGYFTLGITGLGTSFDWSLLPLHMLIATLGNIVGGNIIRIPAIYDDKTKEINLQVNWRFFSSKIINYRWDIRI
ncbi:MAG: formate/nitrite transporter family protein [Thomasclavelia sp.]